VVVRSADARCFHLASAYLKQDVAEEAAVRGVSGVPLERVETADVAERLRFVGSPATPGS
jgi:hypothetical protein